MTWQPVFLLFAWSLATEEQFYVTWPAIQKRLTSTMSIVFVFTVVGLVETIKAGVFARFLPASSLTHTVVTSIATPICFGVLLANVLNTSCGYAMCRHLLAQRWRSLLAFAIVIACFAISEPANRFRPMSPVSQVHFLAIYVAMTVLVASCVMREDPSLIG